MKNSFRLSINSPCKANYDNFTATENGGFCESCHKEVIDFTTMSDTQVMHYVGKTNTATCGRFKASQLKTYHAAAQRPNIGLFTKGAVIFGISLLALCMSQNAVAQNEVQTVGKIHVVPQTEERSVTTPIQDHLVKGTVYDEENNPLPGVNVVLKGTVEGVITDLDGKFEFPRPLQANATLIFSYLGYETKTYTVPKEGNKTLEISMQFQAQDVILMGDIAVEGVHISKTKNTKKKFKPLN